MTISTSNGSQLGEGVNVGVSVAGVTMGVVGGAGVFVGDIWQLEMKITAEIRESL
ncbi:MAG TPA: hypothetical protein VJG32_14200 [Anaerolineae bacterium]|nr:hypothetical protein [Anaerolineae bacterium]